MRAMLLTAVLLLAASANAQTLSGTTLSGSKIGPEPALSVILILSDDFGTTSDERYGATDPDVSPTMPALDTMAAEGARFTAGLGTGQACAVTRAMLYQGIYNQEFGIYGAVGYENYVYGDDNALAVLAAAAGATTVITGKYPFPAQFDVSYPGWGASLDGWQSWSVLNDTGPADYSDWARDYGNPALFAAAPGDGTYNPNTQAMTTYVDEDSTERMLGYYAARDRSARFLGILNLHNIHTAVHDPTAPAPHNATSCTGTNDECLQLMATKMDEQVAAVLAAVDGDNTIVLFASDNGSAKTNEKGTGNEAGLWVPFYAWGRGITTATPSDRVTVADLHATLADLMGVTAYGGSATLRGYSIAASHLGQTCGFTGRCWSDRTHGEWVVSRNATGERIIYDRVNQPDYKLKINYTTGAASLHDISAYNPGDGTEPADLCGGDGCSAAELDAAQETAYNALCAIYASWDTGETACPAL